MWPKSEDVISLDSYPLKYRNKVILLEIILKSPAFFLILNISDEHYEVAFNKSIMCQSYVLKLFCYNSPSPGLPSNVQTVFE
jgi:hypothetical protein